MIAALRRNEPNGGFQYAKMKRASLLCFNMLAHFFFAPPDGFEPPTGWLTATCSTD